MKKIVLFALIVGLIFVFWGCNQPGSLFIDGDDCTDVLYVWGELDEMSETVAVKPGTTKLDFNDSNYPGAEVVLAECTNIYTWGKDDTGTADMWTKKDIILGDIQNYGEIILYAQLFDSNGDLITSTENGIAQFSILKEGSSGWEDANKIAEKHNVISSVLAAAEDGFETITSAGTADPKSGFKGLPGKLLVQGSYDQPAPAGAAVTVHIIALHLKVRGDKPIFTVQYGSGVTVTNGNEIHFTNAKFGDGAVVFGFPDDWPKGDDLKGKKMVFDYIVSGITSADPGNATRIQINLQAANKEDNKANGEHDNTGQHKGQKYVMLDDPEDGDSLAYGLTWTPTDETTPPTPQNGSGSFKIPFDELLTAAASGIDTSADGGIFELTAIRIENNGDTYEGVQKQKTYTLTITSITVED